MNARNFIAMLLPAVLAMGACKSTNSVPSSMLLEEASGPLPSTAGDASVLSPVYQFSRFDGTNVKYNITNETEQGYQGFGHAFSLIKKNINPMVKIATSCMPTMIKQCQQKDSGAFYLSGGCVNGDLSIGDLGYACSTAVPGTRTAYVIGATGNSGKNIYSVSWEPQVAGWSLQYVLGHLPNDLGPILHNIYQHNAFDGARVKYNLTNQQEQGFQGLGSAFRLLNADLPAYLAPSEGCAPVPLLQCSQPPAGGYYIAPNACNGSDQQISAPLGLICSKPTQGSRQLYLIGFGTTSNGMPINEYEASWLPQVQGYKLEFTLGYPAN